MSLGKNIFHLEYLRKTWSVIWKSSGKWTLVNLALTSIQGFFPLIIIYLIKEIIDRTTLAYSTADKEKAFASIFFIIIITGVFYIFNALINALANLVKSYHTQIVSDHVSGLLQKKATEVDLWFYDNPAYYDKLYRAKREAGIRPAHIVEGLGRLLQASLSLLLMLMVLITFHWSIALVLFIATFPGVFIRFKHNKRLFHWQKMKTPDERAASYYDNILTTRRYAFEVRIQSLKELISNRFKDIRTTLRKEKLRMDKKRFFADLITQSGSAIAIFASFTFISYKTLIGEISIGLLVMYFLAFQRGLNFFRDILNALASLYEDNLFLSNLYEFLNIKNINPEPEKSMIFPDPVQKGIFFREVHFHYPDKENILKGINMDLPRGKTIALVGENGSGKSTVVKLLCKFYLPQEGSIRVDDIEYRELSAKEIHKHIAAVFQDYASYNLSANDNIWFGKIEEPINHKKIIEKSKEVGIDQILEALPHKYKSILGKYFNEGEELSIGEWQKIAIARALYRDAQIVILDEPSSALDPLSEFRLFNNFSKICSDKTSLIISHRFSTVKNADYIYVLDQGKIIEEGSHVELMKKEKHYAKLYQLQADRYH
jgi:ATP-binding cassette, subfamily B, bacterial